MKTYLYILSEAAYVSNLPTALLPPDICFTHLVCPKCEECCFLMMSDAEHLWRCLLLFILDCEMDIHMLLTFFLCLSCPYLRSLVLDTNPLLCIEKINFLLAFCHLNLVYTVFYNVLVMLNGSILIR